MKGFIVLENVDFVIVQGKKLFIKSKEHGGTAEYIFNNDIKVEHDSDILRIEADE